MFYGIEPFYCTIYRLQGYTDYDFSTSDEGEVEELWGIVSFGTQCSYDYRAIYVRRRTDGMVDTGRRNFYVEGNVDIRNGDRVAVNNSFYTVVDAEPIYDLRRNIHHYECIISLVDWNVPDIITQWVDLNNSNLPDIKEVAFDFETTSPFYLYSLDSGDTVGKVAILIEEVFNDSDSTLSIGIDSDHEIIMSEDDNILTSIKYYEIISSYEASESEGIYLYIDPKDSTSGSGRIFIEIIRAT